VVSTVNLINLMRRLPAIRRDYHPHLLAPLIVANVSDAVEVDEIGGGRLARGRNRATLICRGPVLPGWRYLC